MQKTFNIRASQPVSLEDFIDSVLKHPTCEFCTYREECEEDMGFDILETLGEYTCACYDNSIEGLTRIYRKKYAIGT
jgi:hypothetical protein